MPLFSTMVRKKCLLLFMFLVSITHSDYLNNMAYTTATKTEKTSAPEANDVLSDEVFFDFPPFMRVLKNGTVDRYVKVEWVPPTLTSSGGVLSKDVVISSNTSVLSRLFIPKDTVLTDTTGSPHRGNSRPTQKKLPLVVYIHGGAYCIESAFSSIFHPFVSSLVAEGKVVALSVNYRLTPENPITDCYEDTWAAIQWAVTHRTGNGPEYWLNRYVDFDRVFFAGDSAGGNIASNMAWRIGTGQGEGFNKKEKSSAKLVGICLIHPFFGLDDKPNALWELYCPDSQGIADPRLNPILHPEVLKELGCKKALVCVAENDEFGLRERGVSYVDVLKKSGWDGKVELFESLGEKHDFQLFDPDKDTARELRKKITSFFN